MLLCLTPYNISGGPGAALLAVAVASVLYGVRGGSQISIPEPKDFGSYPTVRRDLNRSPFWLSPRGGKRFPVLHAASKFGRYLVICLGGTSMD